MDQKGIVEPTLADKVQHPTSHSATSTIDKVMSSIITWNPVKKYVSQHRRRFTEDGFDLDLTYISENLIAMGYPAEKLEGIYRNNIDEVVRFLEAKHKNHYKVYNLCAERSYDVSKFQERVAHYPFDDHNPPCMDVIAPFCEDVHTWLLKDPKNVAVVHCKAGKGRTGVMMSCYMLHSRQFDSAIDALNYYGSQRTTDQKGVTIPSQRRYVDYYAQMIWSNLPYRLVKLFVKEIRFEPIPFCFSTNQGSICFTISELQRSTRGNEDEGIKLKRVHRSVSYDIKKGSGSFREPLLAEVSVQGDVKVEFYRQKMKKIKKEKLFHFWFNTFFVNEILRPGSEVDDNKPSTPLHNTRSYSEGDVNSRLLVLTVRKNELDSAHKDKHNKTFPSDFTVTLVLEPQARDNGADVSASRSVGVANQPNKIPSETAFEAESSIDSSNPEDDNEDNDACWGSA